MKKRIRKTLEGTFVSSVPISQLAGVLFIIIYFKKICVQLENICGVINCVFKPFSQI